MCSEVVSLDPEKFKNISIPFDGETDEDFFNYLTQNMWDFQDIYDEFDDETWSELSALFEPEWTEYSNSAWKYEDTWYESGNVDEEYTRTGGFEVIQTTDNY
jgi:hypothetical protein